MPTTLPPGAAGDPTTMARIVKGAPGTLGTALLDHLRSLAGPTLRAAHLQVFENVEPEGIRLTTLAERAGMSHQAMGELVAELVELGFVERVRDADDRRSRLVRPTIAGRALVDAGRRYLERVRADWQRALGDSLSVDDVLAALAALGTILSADRATVPAVSPRSSPAVRTGAAAR